MTPNPEDLQPIQGAEASIVAKLKSRFGDAYGGEQLFRGDLSVWVAPAAVADALRFLKTDPDLLYEFLTDITAVDGLGQRLSGEPRFEIVYILYSHTFSRRLLLKTRVDEDVSVPTATTVWRGANFMEREVYDMCE